LQLVPDIVSIARDIGIAVAMALCLGYILFRLLSHWFTDKLAEHTRAIREIMELRQSIANGDSGKFLYRSEII